MENSENKKTGKNIFSGPRVAKLSSTRPFKNLFSGFFLVIIFFAFLFLIPQKHNLADIKEVKITGQNIKVDLATTSSEREQGLSGRSGLKENEGMLFIFPQSGHYFFWMKDMNFPIDMIWLAPSENGDREAKVIYIKKDARPELYPETYGPDISLLDVKYVLEVVSGFSDKNDLKVGDKIEFVY